MKINDLTDDILADLQRRIEWRQQKVKRIQEETDVAQRKMAWLREETERWQVEIGKLQREREKLKAETTKGVKQ